MRRAFFAYWNVLWHVFGLVLCLVLDGPACFSPRPRDPVVAAKAAADKYCGVSCRKRDCVFTAQLQVGGELQYIGSFKSAKQAAEAYDAKLRSLFSDDKQKLKTYLNFPSKKEASYSETTAQARQRGLRISGRNNRNEARAFELFREAFAASSNAEGYEIVPLTGASRADAVFRHKGSGEDGLLISSKRPQVEAEKVAHTYSAMLMDMTAWLSSWWRWMEVISGPLQGRSCKAST